MIAHHALAIIWLALVGVTYSRLLKRQDGFDNNRNSSNNLNKNTKFRTFTIASGLCLLLAALIFWLSAFSAYSNWFVPTVYPVLDWLRIALVIAGGTLIIWAFIQKLETDVVPADKGAQIPGESGSGLQSASATSAVNDIPQTSLASLNALRVSLSQPYPFAELARAALTGVSEVAGVAAGALYVHNESTHEMTLVASQGLSPAQERAFERLSLGASVLSEVFAEGETLISSSFSSGVSAISGDIGSIPGPYSLLTPIFRNNQPLGLVVLFSTAEPQLSKSQIVTLAQMSDIVADKFVNVKLRGELARAEKRSAEREESRKRLTQVFQRAFEALSGSSLGNSAELEAMCQVLVGIGGADAVALVELDEAGAILRFAATSNDFPSTTDGFERATIQALKRQSLVLLSREKRETASGGDSSAEREPMALVAPLGSSHAEAGSSRGSRNGILFWNSYGRFYLGAEELHEFQDWLRPLTLALGGILRNRISGAAAGMLEIVRELLQPVAGPDTEKTRMKLFLASIRRVLGLQETALVFKRSSNGQLRPMMSFGVAYEDVAQLVILAGEGSLGRCAALGNSVIEEGSVCLARSTEEYDMLNRDVFGDGFARMGPVGSLLIAPITVNGATRFVLQFFFADAEIARNSAKVILPLCQLMALVISVEELQVERGADVVASAGVAGVGGAVTDIVNDINNDLLTIIGNCQLAAEDPNLSGGLDKLLQLVIDRAEHSAKLMQSGVELSDRKVDSEDGNTATLNMTKSESSATSKIDSSVSLTEELREFAAQRVVGGQILLTEGKAREVECLLDGDFRLGIDSGKATTLIEKLCHGLSALADEREIVTVSVYDDRGYSYLDISRRWRNLPLTDRIGSYARFGAPAEGIFDISAATVQALSEIGVEIALDRRSNRPAYVTLRNRIDVDSRREMNRDASKGAITKDVPRILAIDDQTMILDLLGAMCDSLGYQIDTFDSPERAIAAFERGVHDVVITDVAMPGIDGWEVAEAIKKLRPETYLIFITGWEEGLSAERLRDCGVNHVLKKPFRLEQLTESLLQAERLSKPTATT